MTRGAFAIFILGVKVTIYVILMYLYVAHFVFHERIEHHLHESSIRIVKLENLAIWWYIIEIINFRNFGL